MKTPLAPLDVNISGDRVHECYEDLLSFLEEVGMKRSEAIAAMLLNLFAQYAPQATAEECQQFVHDASEWLVLYTQTMGIKSIN